MSGQATAREAVGVLVDGHGYIEPTQGARRNIAMAFAGAGKVVYGKAFDLLQVEGDVEVDLEDLSSVVVNLKHLALCEVKSTNRDLGLDFAGYFFSVSTAEVLVAQSLGAQFTFAFVNTKTGTVLDMTLKELYERAKAIYPAWSIRI